MYRKYHKIFRRMLTVALTAAMITGLTPPLASSAETVTIRTTHYNLITGVVFAWCNSSGVWQNGIKPGSVYSYYNTVFVGNNYENVIVYNYNSSVASSGSQGYFNFDDSQRYHWNKNSVTQTKYDYDRNYTLNAASGIFLDGMNSYNPSTGNIAIHFSGSLIGGYDVKTAIASGYLSKVEALLGGASSANKAALDAMNPGKSSFNKNVKGYMYFFPAIIQYDVITTKEIYPPAETPTLGALTAYLDLPSTGVRNQAYTVKDASVISGLTVKDAVLKKKKGGEWQTLVTWPGPGKAERNTGGKIDQTEDSACEITYELTVTATNGATGMDTKKIIIRDDRSTEIKAELSVPNVVYEGHSVRASDNSRYYVNGEYVPSVEMYNAGDARNEYAASPDSGAMMEPLEVYDREITWPKTGNYSVTLNIASPIDGKKDSDTKPVEVLKTPAIFGNLSGNPMENRKQTVAGQIVTNPNYPLREVWVEIKEKESGESVKLYKGSELVNSENIKTRKIEEKGSDKYFTNIELPFLTKYHERKDFIYTIYAEDSRGQTARFEREFTVVPDRSPQPDIGLATEFIRKAGSNTAEIAVADLSKADPGDQLERIWYVSSAGIFKNAEEISGYADLAFGAGREISFEKEGVGPVDVKIRVKDVWTDETLPEYINESDYHTAESGVYRTEVSNVAPVVSLEARKAKKAEILLLAASQAEYADITARKNELERMFIEKGIDANLVLRKLEPLPAETPGVNRIFDIEKAFGANGKNSFLEKNSFTVDNDTFYLMTGEWKGGNSSYYPQAPYRLTAYDARTGNEKWAYSMNSGVSGEFGHDDVNKYLYFYSDTQTRVFDKYAGACLGVLNFPVGKQNYIVNENLYYFRNNGVYRADLKKGEAERVYATPVSGPSRMIGGKIHFFTNKGDGEIYRGIFDPESEKIVMRRLPTSDDPAWSQSRCIGIDSGGVVVVAAESPYTGGYNAKAVATNIYDAGDALIKTISVQSPTPVYDEKENVRYIAGAMITFDNNRDYSYGYLKGIYDDTDLSKQNYSGSRNCLPLCDPGRPLIAKMIGNKVYLQLGADFDDDPDLLWDPIMAPLYIFDLSSKTVDIQHSSLFGFGSFTEYSAKSDALYAASLTFNNYAELSVENRAKYMVSAWNQSAGDILCRYMRGYMKSERKDYNAVVLLDHKNQYAEASASLSPLAGDSVFVKIADTKTVHLTEDIVNKITKPDEISNKLVIVRPKSPSMESGISRGYQFDRNRTYYYEYEAKFTGASPEGLLSFSVNTVKGEESAGAEKYYVVGAEFDDFSGGRESVFTYPEDRAATGEYIGAALNSGSSKTSADRFDSSDISFSVPEGREAVLSFDYKCTFNGIDSYIAVDGRRWSGVRAPGGGYYVHDVVLRPGTHTIYVRVQDLCELPANAYIIINNLELNYISKTPPEENALTPIPLKSAAEDGWTKYEGSVKGIGRVKSYRSESLSADAATDPANEGSFFADGDDDKIYFEDENWQNTGIFSLKASGAEEWRLRDFRVYYISGGERVYVHEDSLESAGELSAWNADNAAVSIVDESPASAEREAGAMVYKKGEPVLHNIFYSDYENDPAEQSFWRYAHTPFSDGPHPEADIIKDPLGKLVSARGVTLADCISRFYIDGKYVAEHWRMDDTDRAGDDGVDHGKYNKFSNSESVTFYIESDGEAPWVNYIKTDPGVVMERKQFKIIIGVDDKEKDSLTLQTEVYLDGKLFYSHCANGLEADEDGLYPVVSTDLAPAAETGVYSVVCTVSDQSGAGIGKYEFTVVSEGKIEGLVHHTDQWDENRKLYNVKRFGDEINREIPYADYVKLSLPRKRGVNVFWSGERFLLRADVAGDPERVTCEIRDYAQYNTVMTDAGTKNGEGERIYEGSLWWSDMINKWGRTTPAELTFVFNAYYDGDVVKTCEAKVIVDSKEDYWQLHRLY
ncbi:MAG: hypothetical protein LBT34_03105 [Clostridiales Family XIII bacterium]|jgi:hypothetical protein|nr:hypothetical protein [Clostridiales Family XIII bacterium]